MITELQYVNIIVHNLELALAFYTEKMGFEKRMDVQRKDNRWLTLGVKGQKSPEIILQMPSIAEHGKEQYERKLAQIGNGTTWILSVDNCRKTVEEFRIAGVEIVEEPFDSPWGVSALVKDLYGNLFSLNQTFSRP